jgi:FAD:protein FMN transferase
MTRVLCCLLSLLGGTALAAPVTEVHYVMGTLYRITVDAGARPAMRACFQDARRLEDVFSRFLAASELSRVNETAGRPRRVSPDFARLFAESEHLSALTDGAFDVTIGPLTALWRRDGAAPTARQVSAARTHVGAGRATLAGGVLSLPAGARLDFDGIAKGYAVDRCVELLRAAGVERALVSLGESSLYGLGVPEDAPDWAFAVRGADPEQAVGVLHLKDAAASVSSVFAAGERRAVGHIVDPRSGKPLVRKAIAVAIAPTATAAEAYTKALLLWGADGVERLEGHGAQGAVHVEGGVVHMGAGARRLGCFEAAPARLAVLREEVR